MKKIFILLILSSTCLMLPAQNPSYQQKLYYTCKVWGFTKYFHSRVSVCQVNWDSVLLHTLPLIKNSATKDELNNAIGAMLAAAGPMEIATTPLPDTIAPELKRNRDFGWINDPLFRNDIKVILDTIKNNFRPHDNCWVAYGTSGLLNFPFDDPMIDSNAYSTYPSENTRLMILFKLWNILRYFNPYNYVLDTSPDSTLYNHLLTVASAADYSSFFKEVKRITSAFNDAHVEGLTWSSSFSLFGSYRPRILLRYSHGKYIVVKTAYTGLSKGDIVMSVDGKSTQQWEDSLRPLISAGNPSVFRRFMCSYMLCGPVGSSIIVLSKDSVGNEHSLTAPRNFGYDSWYSSYYPNDTLGNVKFKLWAGNVGYVNMGKLVNTEVDSMYYNLMNTSAIIFDIRNYPNGTAWSIANYMYPGKKCFAKFTCPDIHYPGTYYWVNDYLGVNGNPFSYQGKVIILCNQETQSQAEFSCMTFGAMTGSVVIGSQTAGADGNVVYFHLSQEIQSGFTGLGVFYPNGDSTQRIGIVPDSLVYITPEGVRQGRDEVLEKALQVAGCLEPMLSVTPSVKNVTATEGSSNYTVTCNTNWSAMSDASWCLINSSGSGNGSILAVYSENTTYQSRTANILITVAGLPDQTVALTQAKSSIGIAETTSTTCRVFPNPSRGLFAVSMPSGETGPMDVFILDIQGRVILKRTCRGKTEYPFDMQDAPQGIYTVIIKLQENQIVKKLSIIH